MLRLALAAGFGFSAMADETPAHMAFLQITPEDKVAVLKGFEHLDPQKVDQAFEQVYNSFLEQFDSAAYQHLVDSVTDGVGEITNASFLTDDGFHGYRSVADTSKCLVPGASAANVAGIAAHPGGPTARVFGFDLSKMLVDLVMKSSGSGTGGIMVPILMAQGISMAMGMIKAILNVVLQVVPPMIPPPFWINQPLTCLPMLTGKNCFGAVLYPITAADFMSADTTDAGLTGAIDSFPSLYAQKVGKTPDVTYKRCFSAYMSMKCGAAFPSCQVPMASAMPGHKLPVCITSCIATLALCPGFWIDDIMGDCSMASIPPFCSQAIFLNNKLAPPQLQSYEESAGQALECPTPPAAFGGDSMPSKADFDLYSPGAVETSPYSAALPNA